MNLQVVISDCVDGRSVRLSERCREVAGLFGLMGDQAGARREVRVMLEVKPGEVVLIRGASGTGKSTLLGRVEAALLAGGVSVMRLEEVALDENAAVVDCFGEPLERALEMLSRAGLSEARLMVRSPRELSAGEAFRYRLARFMAGEARVLVADEFGAVLDRTTARVVAWQLGRFVRVSAGGDRPRSAVVATSHEDLVEDLRPAVVVTMGDGGCQVERAR
jgi:ABC-type ATPase with predicted acetyltransferase domain